MKILDTTTFINEKLIISPISKTRLSDIKENSVIATDDTIKDIVKDAMSKYGNEADLNFIQTYKVTDMSGLFMNTEFNGDISKWDVGNVVKMAEMFKDSSFNGDISKWDVSNVKYMEEMFSGASKFNQDISKWNVTNVYDMSHMFSSAREFNQDISDWNVTNCEHMEYMFKDAKAFDQDLSKWIAIDTDTSNMFIYCPMSSEPEKHPINYDTCIKYITDYYEENIDDSETEGRADTYEELMDILDSNYEIVCDLYDYYDTRICRSKKDGTYCIIHTREYEDDDTVYYEVLDITPVEQYAKYL